jgi:uroporphyrinogen-III synthase
MRSAYRFVAEHSSPIWLIFFAPSSGGFVIPHLRIYFCLPTMAEPCTHAEGLSPVKIGAIGPTTSEYLHMDEGLHVHVVASEPTASCLAAALYESDAATMEDIC